MAKTTIETVLTNSIIFVKNGEPIRRKSLIEDAKFDTYTNIGLHKLEANQKSSVQYSIDEAFIEDNEDTTLNYWTCVVSLKSASSIGAVVREFEVRLFEN